METYRNGGGVLSNNDHHNGSHADINNGSEDDTIEYAPIIKAPKQISSKKGQKNAKGCVLLTERQQELVRLIGQTLRDLGFERTAEELVEESGFHFENPLISRFRASVLGGNWDQAITELQNLKNNLSDITAFQKVKFAILEQKFLELLDDGKFAKALSCLRSELSCMNCDAQRLQQLSIFFFVPPELFRKHIGLSGKCRENRQQVVDKIQGFLPECMMLPPARLRNLLSQAVEGQRKQCRYHNTKLFDSAESISLLSDHKCSKERLPCTLKQTLTDHCDEVLHLKFSPDGNYLATGSRDRHLIIWNVAKDTHQLTRHSSREWRPISYVAWSPDSRLVLACGVDDCTEVMVFDVQLSTVRLKTNINGDDSLTYGCFVGPTGDLFATGGIRGQLYLCDMNGTVVKQIEGIRLQDIAWMPGTHASVVIADTHSRLRLYNFDDRSDKLLIKEDQRVLSFSLTLDGRYAAVNIAENGVHLWDLRERHLVRKMFGFVQTNLAIYSTFGGHNEDFVASGSEDGLVRIWHRNFEEPVIVLEGHSKPVNCVHWNPTMCSMLATCSDDTLVHIWTTVESCCSDLAAMSQKSQSVQQPQLQGLSQQQQQQQQQPQQHNNGSQSSSSKPNERSGGNIGVGMPNVPSMDGSMMMMMAASQGGDDAMVIETNHPDGISSDGDDDDEIASEDGEDDDIEESVESGGESEEAAAAAAAVSASAMAAAAVRMVASGVGAAEVVAALMAGAPPPPLLSHPSFQPPLPGAAVDSSTHDGDDDGEDDDDGDDDDGDESDHTMGSGGVPPSRTSDSGGF